MNKLVLGDNLEVLRGIPSESVDLIYLDPPFFLQQALRVHLEFGQGGDQELRGPL